MTWWKAAALAVLLVGAVFWLMFAGLRTEPKPKRESPTAQKVEAPAPVEHERTFPCRIVPRQSIWAGTPRTGQVDAVYAEVGQTVTDGEVLARVKSDAIPPSAAAAEEQAAREQERQVVGRLAEAQGDAKRLQTEVTRARNALGRVESVFQRQEQLYQAGATPRLQFERARDERGRAVSELASVEEASRQTDNLASRLSDERRQAAELLREKRKTAAGAASGVAEAEIHAPAAGMIVERTISGGAEITEANRMALFRIAIQPEQLRAEFNPGFSLAVGQSISIHAADVQIRAAVTGPNEADFESRSAGVRIGSPCEISVRIK